MGLRNRRMLSVERALPCDVLHFARKIPIARAEMAMDLAAVASCRSVAQPRVSWAAVFLKAYGIVSDRNECLRSSYMRWPLPHAYHHSRSVATIAIHREHEGRPRLCWGRIVDPGHRPLVEIQSQLDHFRQGPTTQVFRKQLRLGRMPCWLRRVAWWVTLNGSGKIRERQIGTFSMSTLAGQGVINREHPTLCTSSVTYGPVESNRHALITLVYDHRMFDGMQAAMALSELRICLKDEICTELRKNEVGKVAA